MDCGLRTGTLAGGQGGLASDGDWELTGTCSGTVWYSMGVVWVRLLLVLVLGG